MKRLLIVNADDCNLTPGVTAAILDSYDHGIVSSTTFLINLPVEAKTVRELKKRKGLGVGLHLNVTLGQVAPKFFGKLLNEYDSQIKLFRKIFGRLPTHLDTHHQLHDQPFFYRAVCEVANQYRLPMRRSRLNMTSAPCGTVPEYLFGSLAVENYWREETLRFLLRHLPEGVSEIMCHPGMLDARLRAISSFTTGRAAEWKLFRQPSLRKLLIEQGIGLTHYGLCYTS